MKIYPTDEDYKIAESNGICKKTVDNRWRNLGWAVELAISTPVRGSKNKESWQYWKDKSVVSERHFYKRKSRGWTAEKAAITPPRERLLMI